MARRMATSKNKIIATQSTRPTMRDQQGKNSKSAQLWGINHMAALKQD